LDALIARLSEEKAALAAAASAEGAAKAAEVSAKKTEVDARTAESRAKQQEAAATEAENAARAAADEQKAALSELQSQQEAKENTLKALDAKINDPSGTTVTKGKAKNEYEQLKGTDPLPLQRAKINQGATVRKFERTQRVAEDERKKATDLREQAQTERERAENDRAKAEFERERAVAERKHAEDSTTAVAAAVVEAEKKFDEAVEFLEAEKKKPNIRHGDIWWLGRQLEEKKKYLPKSKGGNW
jgi:colicin import membrane protein